MGIDRFVCLCVRQIGEKRLLGFSLALVEIDGVIGDFPVNSGAFDAIIYFMFFWVSHRALKSLCK